jgi:flavin-dependent dehydrogenase
MSGLEVPDPPDTIVTMSGFMKEGPASFYLLPRFADGERNVLVTSFTPRADLQVALDYFMNKTMYAPWFKKAKRLKAFSAILSFYTPIIAPYKDRVLVIGDAASCVDLENTGAMLSGFKAGHAISTAVQEKNLGLETSGISNYLNWWKKDYIDVANYEAMTKGVGLRLILTTEEEINYYMGLIKETLPPLWAPGGTEQGKKVARAIAKATSIIEQDRPDIFQKLKRMRSLPGTEIYTELTKISKPMVGAVDASLHPSI